MDSRYRSSVNMPHRYDQTSTTNPSNRSNPISSRYFHRPPLIYPQNIHRHPSMVRPNLSTSSVTASPPIYASTYLGPLPQHRPRFLSSWDLAPTPTMYLSSRNINAPTASPSRVYDQGACMFNSCVPFHASNWPHTVDIVVQAIDHL